jgi:hypothetical protein
MPLWRRQKCNHVYRTIFFTFIYSAAGFFSTVAMAKEATVFDVRRPLAMENNETPPKDYLINAGSADGLKSGMLVTVSRRSAVYDQYQNKSPGDLVVTVGQLRLIHVQSDLSVARLEVIHSREALPTIEFEAIMAGDKVDLDSAKMGSKKTAMLAPIEVELKTSETMTDVHPIPSSNGPSATGAPASGAAENSKDFSSIAPQAPVSVGSSL